MLFVPKRLKSLKSILEMKYCSSLDLLEERLEERKEGKEKKKR
jgi:hypothetical protein